MLASGMNSARYQPTPSYATPLWLAAHRFPSVVSFQGIPTEVRVQPCAPPPLVPSLGENHGGVAVSPAFVGSNANTCSMEKDWVIQTGGGRRILRRAAR